MSRRELHIVDNKIQVKPLPEDLALSDYGVIYVFKDEKGLIYKLHQHPKLPSKQWSWMMMNNSTGRLTDCDSMEEAISYAMKRGFTVYEMSMKDFCLL